MPNASELARIEDEGGTLAVPAASVTIHTADAQAVAKRDEGKTFGELGNSELLPALYLTEWQRGLLVDGLKKAVTDEERATVLDDDRHNLIAALQALR